MIKFLLIALALFVTRPVLAQKPNYVPFRYHGQIGIMETNGSIFVNPGTFGADYTVVDDFKAYILTDELLTNENFFFNAVSGKGASGISGIMDSDCGALSVGEHTFFHFKVDGNSMMVSLGKDPMLLQEPYIKIEPNRQAWDNENLSDNHLVWALKADGTYDLLWAEQHFRVVAQLPVFESYDLIFNASGAAPMKLQGFVLGNRDAIDREFGQMYDIPSSEQQVEVYDLDFKKLGTSAYQTRSISTLFKEDIQLRGTMMAPPALKNQIIYSDGNPLMLNEEFSLMPDTADNSRLVLVNTKKNNEPVLGNADFDYRYFSTSDHLKALLQIRHLESGSIFYFDFDGTFFPRGIPMIPKSMMEWK